MKCKACGVKLEHFHTDKECSNKMLTELFIKHLEVAHDEKKM